MTEEHRLDRPDREKIKWDYVHKATCGYISADEATDGILALIPDIEQRVSEALEDNTLTIIEEAKKQGKFEERERIKTDLEPLMAEARDILDWSLVWQYVRNL